MAGIHALRRCPLFPQAIVAEVGTTAADAIAHVVSVAINVAIINLVTASAKGVKRTDEAGGVTILRRDRVIATAIEFALHSGGTINRRRGRFARRRTRACGDHYRGRHKYRLEPAPFHVPETKTKAEQTSSLLQVKVFRIGFREGLESI